MRVGMSARNKRNIWLLALADRSVALIDLRARQRRDVAVQASLQVEVDRALLHWVALVVRVVTSEEAPSIPQFWAQNERHAVFCVTGMW